MSDLIFLRKIIIIKKSVISCHLLNLPIAYGQVLKIIKKKVLVKGLFNNDVLAQPIVKIVKPYCRKRIQVLPMCMSYFS